LWQSEEPDHIVREFKKLGLTEKKRYREPVKDLGLSDDDPKKIGHYKDVEDVMYTI
jgi:hypothetical protein